MTPWFYKSNDDSSLNDSLYPEDSLASIQDDEYLDRLDAEHEALDSDDPNVSDNRKSGWFWN